MFILPNYAYALIMKAMQRPPLNQSGFIPMLLTILIVVIAAIYLVYTRVVEQQ